MPFINENFMLSTDAARELYHGAAVAECEMRLESP